MSLPGALEMTDCTVCKQPPNPEEAIKNGDIDDLNEAISSIEDEVELTKLLTLVILKGKPSARAALTSIVLKKGARVDSTESAMQCTPLHLAMERGQCDVVRKLLKHGAQPDARNSSSETALHCAIRGLRQHSHSEQAVIACLNILPLNEELLNAMDNIGEFTAIHLAVKFKKWDIVKFLLQKNANVDIEVDNITARQLIKDQISSLSPEFEQLLQQIPIGSKPPPDLLTKLFESLEKENEDQFLEIVMNNPDEFKKDIDKSNGKSTLLQMAASKGYIKACNSLIEAGANVNLTRVGTTKSPAMIAAESGHAEVLKILLNTSKVDLSGYNNEYHQRTALHLAVLSDKCNALCVKLLLAKCKEINLDINAQDFRGCTALHYAGRKKQTEIITLLLKYKTINIFIEDFEKIPAFFDIPAEYINDYLDDHITTQNSVSSKDYSLVLNYNFIVNTINKKSKDGKQNEETQRDQYVQIGDVECAALDCETFGPEMDPLLMLTNSPVHRKLLNHPIIKSFLHLKWYKIKWIFYFNLIFYLTFTLSLSFYVYQLVTSEIENVTETAETANVTETAETANVTETAETANEKISNEVITIIHKQFFWWLTVTMVFILGLRELLQIISFPQKHFSSIENWVEIIIIILTVLLLCLVNSFTIYTIAALAVLLSYSELVLLVGRHPCFSIYFTMFWRVSTSLMYFLSCYSLLIFGFAFALFIVFQKCNSTNEEYKTNYFNELGTSIFKTVVMLTGELEVGDIQFKSCSVVSYVLFLFFLVFITIVLLNLLNGLAVSDTQAIRNEAEVVSSISQVQLFAKLESVLLNKAFCVGVKKFLGESILLMHQLRKKEENTNKKEEKTNKKEEINNKLYVMLNDGNKMDPDVRGTLVRNCTCAKGMNCVQRNSYLRKACPCCRVFNSIVSDAQSIVVQRGQLSETQQILSRITQLEANIGNIAKDIQNIIYELQNNKCSPGPDSVHPEYVKQLGPIARQTL